MSLKLVRSGASLLLLLLLLACGSAQAPSAAAQTHTEHRMPIKVIVEFQAKPGMRDEFLRTLEQLATQLGPNLSGYRGSTRFAVVDQPDMLVEIAEWDSVEARNQHMEQARATNAFAPLMPLMGAPFRITVLEPLH